MPHSRADAIVARSRALIGTRFVPHGRDSVRGLDCVGLVAAALRLETPPALYAMRCGSLALLDAGMAAAGLVRPEAIAPGDVMAVQAGPGQLHLGIWSGDSLIHADAGLRRVVERPTPLPWPQIGAWRLPDEEDATWRH